MSETRCDDVDMDIVKTDMDTLGFDIIYKNRHRLSRNKSGGLLIAIKKTVSCNGEHYHLNLMYLFMFNWTTNFLVYKNILVLLLFMFHPAIQGMVRLIISMRQFFDRFFR